MREEVLHFIWETHSYHREGWQTGNGEMVRVIDPGQLNHNQGPDFLDAQIEVGGIVQYGHVEIHIEGEDWYRHRHDRDPHYNAVVLHVVLRRGRPIRREDGTLVPEVSLEGRIHAGLIAGSTRLSDGPSTPTCRRQLTAVPEVVKTKWLRRVAAERLEGKLLKAREKLEAATWDWERVIWQELAGYLAGPINKSAFQTLCEHLPIKVIGHYRSQPFAREALLFGSACLLSGTPVDDYQSALKGEWAYLSAKHRLHPAPIMLRRHRMRPANSPTIRLAQLGVLIGLRTRLVELLYPNHLTHFADQIFETPEYWQSHYQFGKIGRKCPRQIGRSVLRSLLLNCLIPLSVLYAEVHGIRTWEQQVRLLARQVPPENNRFIRAFVESGMTPEHADDGQAFIHLYQNYCQPKRCLQCGFGRWMLQQ